MLFIINRSYIYIFVIFATTFLFVGGALPLLGISHLKHAVILIPLIFVFIAISEVRSGIALNPMWQAKILRGSSEFTGTVVFHLVFALISMLVCISQYYPKV